MSDTSPSAVDGGRQKLAVEAFVRLSKAITTATAMADGVQLDAMCMDAHRAIHTFLEHHGRLSITLGETSRIEGAPIDGATIVVPILRQRIGRVSFERGLTSDDTRALVQAWADSLEDDELSPSSLLTRVWEAQVGSVAGEMQEAAADGHVNRAIQRILGAAPVVDPMKLKALSTPDLRQQLELVNGLSRRQLAIVEPRLAPAYLAIPPDEAASIAASVLERHPDYAARAAQAFVAGADLATRSEFQALTEMLRMAVDDLLNQDAFHDAAKLVEALRQSVQEDRGGAGPKAELLGSLAAVLEADEFMDKLVVMLENADRSAAALTLVESMQRTAVAGLLLRLPRMRTANAKRQLSELIKARVPAVEALCAAVKKCDADGIAEILHIIDERGDDVKRAVRIAALEQPNVQVQAAIIETIPVADTADLGRWIFPLAAARDASLRKTVRERAMAAKDPAAVQSLLQSLDDPNLDKNEIKAVVSAIGSVGGARAADVLRRLADQSKDNDMKVQAIQAIGSTGDPGVIPWLEGYANKLLVWPALKTAAKDAIKRIEKSQRRGSEPDSEDVATIEDMATEPIPNRMRTTSILSRSTGDSRLSRSSEIESPKSISRAVPPTPTTFEREPRATEGAKGPRSLDESRRTTRRTDGRRTDSISRAPPERTDSVVREGRNDSIARERRGDSVLREGRGDSVLREGRGDSIVREGTRPKATKDSPSRMPEERTPPERRSKDAPSLDVTTPIQRPSDTRPKPTTAVPRKVLPAVRKRPPPSDDVPKVAGMPDFDLMFKNYVHYAVENEHVFARLYVDRLVDVHRFKVASTDDAYSEFFQAKIKEGFLPQASSQEALKGGEPLEELDWNVLAATYAKLMGKA